MKSNPLFHDSTVGQDTNVQTHFELTGLTTLSGDKVYLELDLDEKHLVHEMSFNEESDCFETSVWLKHRKEITYNYYVQRGESIISATPIQQSYAMHSISDHWNEMNEEDLKAFVDSHKKPKTIIAAIKEQNKNNNDNDEFYDNLIKKWDL